jgi:hypothetical protein
VEAADRRVAAGHQRPRAESLHQRFVLRSCHGDHAQPVGDAELNRTATDRAGDTQGLARPEREPIQREAHRQPVHRQGGGLQAGSLGPAGDGRGRNDHHLGLGAAARKARIDDRHHAVTDVPVRALADGVHHPGQLHAGNVMLVFHSARQDRTASRGQGAARRLPVAFAMPLHRSVEAQHEAGKSLASSPGHGVANAITQAPQNAHLWFVEKSVFVIGVDGSRVWTWSLAPYKGHAGRPGEFGSPVRANRVQ